MCVSYMGYERSRKKDAVVVNVYRIEYADVYVYVGSDVNTC
jgi:hypothetical protein